MAETRCDRKQTFKSEDAARRELRKMRRTVIDWSRLSMYRCECHNGWHIGNRRSWDIKRLVTGERAK